MYFWIKTASLFLLRSRSTSIVLALMVLMAISSLIFLSSFAVGINDAMVRNSAGLYSGHISALNIPHDISEEQLMKKGVSAVLRRSYTAGFLHFEGGLHMLTLISVNPAKEKEHTALWKKALRGRYLESGNTEIYLNKTIADKLGIDPGDKVGFSKTIDSPPMTLTVSGVYQTGLAQFDRGISFCAQNTIPDEKGPWNAAIFLDNGIDMEAVVSDYRHKAKTRAITFKTWPDLMPDLRQLIELNYISMSIVIILIFVVISFGIACAFAIFIIKNLRVYGIMKVMGVTPFETIVLIFSKVILVNVVASVLGIIAGSAVVAVFANTGIDLTAYTSHNQYFIVSGMIYPRLTVFSLCLPPASALIFSIPAAIWPAALVIRKNAAEILRSI